MGVLSKVRGMFSGKKDKMHERIEKASDVARSKVGDDKADKVDKAQEVADKAVDKLAGDTGSDSSDEDTSTS